jgi:hypothetical protein
MQNVLMFPLEWQRSTLTKNLTLTGVFRHDVDHVLCLHHLQQKPRPELAGSSRQGHVGRCLTLPRTATLYGDPCMTGHGRTELQACRPAYCHVSGIAPTRPPPPCNYTSDLQTAACVPPGVREHISRDKYHYP